MTQVPPHAPVILAKPQPNIYTLLLILTILALGVTVGIVLYNLLAPVPGGYGLEFGAMFDPSKLPDAIKPPQ